MNYTFQLGADTIKDMVNHTSLLGDFNIIPIFIIILTILILTRDISRMQVVAFPVALLWNTVGLRVPMYILVLTALLLIMQIIGSTTMTTVIEAIKTRTFGSIRADTREIAKKLAKHKASQHVQGYIDYQAKKTGIKKRITTLAQKLTSGLKSTKPKKTARTKPKTKKTKIKTTKDPYWDKVIKDLGL